MAYVTSTPATSTSRSTRSARRSGTAGASPSSTSPTRLSRVQEKDELRHLNDRLAAYIERVRQLENDKSTMLLLLEEKEESKSREMGNVRRLYEAELADARKTLDVLANERARLQIDFGHISEDHRTLQARNHKKETELNAAVIQLRNLEASLNSKDAQYANLLAENRRLENDTSDLQAQLVRLEESLADAKSQLNSEMLRRVDVENQVLTLREQLDFQLHMNEQEVKSLRTRHETRLVEVDSGRQKEFESKLSEAMQQLRQEHEGQIQQYKEELEKNFCSKSCVSQLYVRQAEHLIRTVREPTAAQECVVGEEVEEVQNEQVQIRECTTKLENAKQNAMKSSDVASSTREELAGTKLRIDNLSSQLTHFQKQNGVLEERVRELERTLDREREVWQHRLCQKDQEMSAMRGQMLSQLEDYENLLDVKLALDMEINAYRKMLEGEEQRLNLSPSPSQHGAVARTHVHATRKLRGKKRKHECGPSGSSPAYKVSQHATAHGHVTVAEIDLEGNYVKLKNNSETEQPLGGWVVRRTNPDSPDISFQIPPSYNLAAGQSLTIWASEAGVEPNPPSDLVLMSHRSWGPVNDIRVTLLNLNDEETAERKVLCVQGRVEEDSDVEFDEEYEAGSDVHHLRRQAREGAGEPNCAIM